MTKKTLLLLRHAKSSWKDLQLDDHERPLNSRGQKAASRMGRLLREERLQPDIVLCSSARRTRETADLAFEPFDRVPRIVILDGLYHADSVQMLDLLSNVAEPTSCPLIIGHNPGMEQLIFLLTGKSIRFPTAALARIDFELADWSHILQLPLGTLVRLWQPRELDSD